MKSYRYIATLSTMVCFGAGTLDEAHQQILASRRRNGFRSSYDVIDTWTEPGRVVRRMSGCVWEAA